MQYQIVEANSQATIYLTGKLYLQDIEQLRCDLVQALEKGSKWLTVNLAGVTYIDSSGLSLFVMLHKCAEQLHGGLTLLGAHGMVQEIFKRTRLDTLLSIR
ncbi:MAG: STAS domain-containing protein [Anaeromusa sp.]|uniref:STAS domain-containing protein n=1 Tax=Anaeromusa sp. TaxID=1872520 RepID=UPI002B20D33C|nr:STAS domain-containing protein [Anaeromusa sp.]MEA4834553.1 STAS domain-containing protein [Anaeromusa sp.]NCB78265.1 anti-sigma factor antagonist [Negativicutes bacterium]